jgi:hypothetical protein
MGNLAFSPDPSSSVCNALKEAHTVDPDQYETASTSPFPFFSFFFCNKRLCLLLLFNTLLIISLFLECYALDLQMEFHLLDLRILFRPVSLQRHQDAASVGSSDRFPEFPLTNAIMIGECLGAEDWIRH